MQKWSRRNQLENNKEDQRKDWKKNVRRNESNQEGQRKYNERKLKSIINVKKKDKHYKIAGGEN
jgi:hypothetical protein